MTSATAENDTPGAQINRASDIDSNTESNRNSNVGFNKATAAVGRGFDWVSQEANRRGDTPPAPYSNEGRQGVVTAAAQPTRYDNYSNEGRQPVISAAVNTPTKTSPGRNNDSTQGATSSAPAGTTDYSPPAGGMTTEAANANARAQMDRMSAQNNADNQSARAQNAALDARQTASTGYTAAQDAARDAEFNDKTGDRLATRGHWGMTNRAVAATHADNVTAKQNLIAARTGYESAERGVGAAGQQNFVQNAATQQGLDQARTAQEQRNALGNRTLDANQSVENRKLDLAGQKLTGDQAEQQQRISGQQQAAELQQHMQALATSGKPEDLELLSKIQAAHQGAYSVTPHDAITTLGNMNKARTDGGLAPMTPEETNSMYGVLINLGKQQAARVVDTGVGPDGTKYNKMSDGSIVKAQ